MNVALEFKFKIKCCHSLSQTASNISDDLHLQRLRWRSRGCCRRSHQMITSDVKADQRRSERRRANNIQVESSPSSARVFSCYTVQYEWLDARGSRKEMSACGRFWSLTSLHREEEKITASSEITACVKIPWMHHLFYYSSFWFALSILYRLMARHVPRFSFFVYVRSRHAPIYWLNIGIERFSPRWLWPMFICVASFCAG